MKQLITKPFVVFVLFAAVLNLAGCAVLLNVKKDTQDIVIEAADGGIYDFYVDNKMVCSFTRKCVFVRSKRSVCQHTIDIKRDDDIYGTVFFGYWEEESTLAKMFSKGDNNVCPGAWEGDPVHVIVELSNSEE